MTCFIKVFFRKYDQSAGTENLKKGSLQCERETVNPYPPDVSLSWHLFLPLFLGVNFFLKCFRFKWEIINHFS